MWDPSSVAGHLAISGSIGRARPVGLHVDCFGTETLPLDRTRHPVADFLDVVPAPILCDLDLDFTWERIDRVDALQEAPQR